MSLSFVQSFVSSTHSAVDLDYPVFTHHLTHCFLCPFIRLLTTSFTVHVSYLHSAADSLKSSERREPTETNKTYKEMLHVLGSVFTFPKADFRDWQRCGSGCLSIYTLKSSNERRALQTNTDQERMLDVFWRKFWQVIVGLLALQKRASSGILSGAIDIISDKRNDKNEETKNGHMIDQYASYSRKYYKTFYRSIRGCNIPIKLTLYRTLANLNKAENFTFNCCPL